jgi:nitrous oxide reductase accessory protein NosL
MSMKRFVLVFALLFLLFPLAGGAADDVIESPESCVICGMNRIAFAHSRMVIHYIDGTTVGVCSIRCAAVDMGQNDGKQVRTLQVADYSSLELIDARSATWVIGGNVPGVMTSLPKWAFARAEDATAFIKENGGEIASFDRAMKAAREEVGSSGGPDKHHGHGHHESYAPVGVMGDHTHGPGDWMLSYRYMFMDMEGNRDGTRRVSESDIFAEGFMVAPTEMTMEMHMAGAMYAPTDDVTLMAMLPYIRFSMDHVTMMGVRFTTKSEGIGDARLTGLYVLHRFGRQQVHLNAGVSFPTGSTDERDDTPAGPDQKLPYPMQLGSGTFDLLPGITYVGQTDNWSWGSQLGGTIRIGRNGEGYSLGDRGALTAWGARKWTRWLSTSLRIDVQGWGNIDGRDNDLNPAMVPTADPNRRGGERIDLLFGLNLYGQGRWAAGHRLAVEFGIPIHQSLDGPQLETDRIVTAGWQFVL